MFPLADGKEDWKIKGTHMAMEMKGGQWLGIEPKAQGSRNLCDAFLFLRNYIECFFLLFLFMMWNMRRKKTEVCCDRWEHQNLVMCFVLEYTSVITSSLANKNEMKALRAILAVIRCRILGYHTKFPNNA